MKHRQKSSKYKKSFVACSLALSRATSLSVTEYTITNYCTGTFLFSVDLRSTPVVFIAHDTVEANLLRVKLIGQRIWQLPVMISATRQVGVLFCWPNSPQAGYSPASRSIMAKSGACEFDRLILWGNEVSRHWGAPSQTPSHHRTATNNTFRNWFACEKDNNNNQWKMGMLIFSPDLWRITTFKMSK